MKVVIVIPTYNEGENLKKLIPLLDPEIKEFGHHNIEVLIVDGNSPDGTDEIVKDLGKTYPYVHLLLEKEKAGIGAAYFYGFKHAIADMGAEVLVEMDGDMQHRPEDFTKMLKKFDEGFDYIIGSRFVKGGSLPKEWEIYRKMLSVGGSLFSKIVLGMFHVNDFTTGFKISRVKGFVDKIDFDNVNSASFAYKIDLLYKMHKLGARIAEVPIKFGLRDRGASKIESDSALDALRVVLTLRWEESKSFFKFFITGLIGLATDTALFTFLQLTVLTASVASAVSGFIAMLTTYTINNFWSFSDRKQKGLKKNASNILIYLTSSYIPILFRSWLIDFSVKTFGDKLLVAYSAFFIGILIGLIWNYTVYSKIIWRKK